MIMTLIGIAAIASLVLAITGWIFALKSSRYSDEWGCAGVISIFLCFVFTMIYGAIGTDTNVAYLRENAPSYFAQNGMQIIANEGFIRTANFGENFGGGRCLYQVAYTNAPMIAYRCYIHRWGKDNIQLLEFAPINKVVIVNGQAVISLNQ